MGSRLLTLSTCHQRMENSDLISGCHAKTAIGPQDMERLREREREGESGSTGIQTALVRRSPAPGS